jgi:predicted Fe-S protein YdhL (DUF1289 family)
MACSGCERRRKAMEAKWAELKDKRMSEIKRAKLLHRLRRGKL